ncbi:MAG TPA: HEAT repeat domain-containing protein, partial [Acidimicrobiia bacterium]|nr:HEAT repeat domain-containing protein [Acidimicrobiia bacterium]
RAAAAAVSRDARTLAALVASDPDPKVRAVALAALVRSVPRAQAGAVWQQAAADPHPGVRRRAAELAPRLGRAAPCRVLVTLLADRDSWVAEAAAFALGEHPRVSRRALTELMHAAASHHDPLVREAAVAALGARGDPATRAAVLAACDDKPAIRRRAVLALAAFDGPDVEARLRAALGDPDWQVRQAAEDLLAAPDVTP